MHSFNKIFLFGFIFVLLRMENRVQCTSLHPFWKNTGFCLEKVQNKSYANILKKDILLNLLYIGTLPNNGIRHVRVHWLLDYIFAENVNFQKNADVPIITYNYTYLDDFFNWMKMYNILVTFEVMGIPGGNVVNNLNNNDTQVQLWRNMVQKLTSRYIAKFSSTWVKKWRFESWNEPDLTVYNLLNFTKQGYLNYINATFLGLHDNNLTLSGPAGLFKLPEKHIFCWEILKQCSDNSNQCPFEYITFHAKGNGSADGVLKSGLKIIEEWKKYGFLKRSFGNDESDIMVGWSRSFDWRADVRYPAMVIKVITEYQEELVYKRGLYLKVLSFDNAFLNFHPFYFTQRTLMTRFQMNNTSPHHIQFVRKPIYVTMALLSYLEKYLMAKESNSTTEQKYVSNSNSPRFSVIVKFENPKFASFFSSIITFNQKTTSLIMAAIFTCSNNTFENVMIKYDIKIIVNTLPQFNNSIYRVYYLDNVETNPAKVWVNNGKKSVFPDPELRSKMRQNEGPMMSKLNLLNSTSTIKLKFKLPSIILVHLCGGEQPFPGLVANLRIRNVTFNEVLITWSDKQVKSRCLKTYEVEFCSKFQNCNYQHNFKRINVHDIIFLAFQYAVGMEWTSAAHELTKGFYRTRVVDYWGNFGKYSKVVEYK